ncbi:MAG: proline hydroxylase [Oceanospirillaceae bacterium]|uniref:prolyl hydroxylase family protein n=1 Tax=Neptuniibacter sp. UBA6509 TaxID=1946976 RepID=UPI000C4F6B30|nr:2OG-Fe(II) oxygenase [Neptuniibacter sp. UBA6509]MAY40908.1 proline hydroxylase [Oceanospirillaceae bacterium]|tara:strand:+ start:2632 stop:3966 length:1335 start_codon:yes stop_codon:yes gene_type:complete
MTDKSLPSDWLDWIDENLTRGCDTGEMLSILTLNGFEHDVCTDVINSLSRERSSTPVTQVTYIPKAESDKYTSNIELFTVREFLNDHECTQLIELIRQNLRPSTTTNDAGQYKDYRTSKTCDLSLIDSDFIKEIDRRICKMLGISPENAEGIQGQWYDVGDEFKEHTDYFEPNSKEFQEFGEALGQRTWTFMIYLNNTQAGGETYFKKLDKSFYPNQGTAVIWNNLLKDLTPNPNTLHQGKPVKLGYKAIITKWFRLNGNDNFRDVNETIPPHTQQGFLRTHIPQTLFRQILKFYMQQKHLAKDEHVPGFIHSQSSKASAIIEMNSELKGEIHRVLQPIAESWSGCFLKPTFVYGIREYYNGAILEPHRDRLQTHEISLILNIRQQVNSDWALVIEDHLYRKHSMFLLPGQMLLYEGCRLLHGRPSPLDGELFTNIFVHYEVKR